MKIIIQSKEMLRIIIIVIMIEHSFKNNDQYERNKDLNDTNIYYYQYDKNDDNYNKDRIQEQDKHETKQQDNYKQCQDKIKQNLIPKSLSHNKKHSDNYSDLKKNPKLFFIIKDFDE